MSIMSDLIIDAIYPEDIDFRLVTSLDGEEFGFVLKTLTQSLHRIYPNNLTSNDIFFPKQNKILRAVIAGGAKLLFASLKGYPNDYYGYALVDDRIPGYLVVHWIHLKSNWRRYGIAKLLLSNFDYTNKQIIVTNLTNSNDFNELKSKLDVSYNPYLWTDQ